jgi:hypothetical protein
VPKTREPAATFSVSRSSPTWTIFTESLLSSASPSVTALPCCPRTLKIVPGLPALPWLADSVDTDREP